MGASADPGQGTLAADYVYLRKAVGWLITDLAGLFALGVALVPTDPDRPDGSQGRS